MTGPSEAHLFIGRICSGASGVTRLDAFNTVNFTEDRLYAPEATTSERSNFKLAIIFHNLLFGDEL